MSFNDGRGVVVGIVSTVSCDLPSVVQTLLDNLVESLPRTRLGFHCFNCNEALESYVRDNPQHSYTYQGNYNLTLQMRLRLLANDCQASGTPFRCIVFWDTRDARPTDILDALARDGVEYRLVLQRSEK